VAYPLRLFAKRLVLILQLSYASQAFQEQFISLLFGCLINQALLKICRDLP